MIDPTATGEQGVDTRMHSRSAVLAALSGRWRELFTATLLVMFFAACSSTSPLQRDDSDYSTRSTPSARQAAHSEYEVEKRLRGQVAQWAGTPHVLGGTTARGIDCSAFVQNVYSDAFAIRLPRTTTEQARRGNEVRQRDLRPGDLVFFRPPTKTRHVGVYLGDGEFAHASSSQGVTISDINHDYWQRSYWTSRRVLPDAELPALADRNEAAVRPTLPPPPSTEAPREAAKPKRVGW